jgi:predicted nuclease of predicted toxin-antitoxin system
MSEIRYHFDEHIDYAIAVGLRRRGIDVSTTVEAGLIEATDPEQIEHASKSGRVFVTCDRRIRTSLVDLSAHCGIVIVRPGRKRIGHNVNALTSLHRNTPAEEMMGQILFR